MRINVYGEELTYQVYGEELTYQVYGEELTYQVYGEELTYQNEIVHKVVDGRNFYGVRIFLESSPFLHATAKDDDRSAVTFWVPWTQVPAPSERELVNQAIKELWALRDGVTKILDKWDDGKNNYRGTVILTVILGELRKVLVCAALRTPAAQTSRTTERPETRRQKL
jgi:hypothetical protein